MYECACMWAHIRMKENTIFDEMKRCSEWEWIEFMSIGCVLCLMRWQQVGHDGNMHAYVHGQVQTHTWAFADTYLDMCRHIHRHEQIQHTCLHTWTSADTYMHTLWHMPTYKCTHMKHTKYIMLRLFCHFKSIIIIHKMMVVDSDDKHNRVMWQSL